MSKIYIFKGYVQQDVQNIFLKDMLSKMSKTNFKGYAEQVKNMLSKMSKINFKGYVEQDVQNIFTKDMLRKCLK